MTDQLRQQAPGLDRGVLQLALRALDCADPHAAVDRRNLAVIDYSLPSDVPRLWVFDLARNKLLFKELVAHGRGSGDHYAVSFSNVDGSHQSSLGLFRTTEPYMGRNGYSLRLQGLEPGINDLAYQRAIVIHGADYVSTAFAQKTGRLGRSHGCPAVASKVARPLIDTLKNGHYLFSYYPEHVWLQKSALVNCNSGMQMAARQAR